MAKAASENRGEPTGRGAESPRPAARHGRVLVVEDEPDVAELIRHHLSRDGYDVVVSVTGADALRHARDGRVDAVLLDIMVPQLNGWEVCRRLKEDAETRAIPVIMVTGRVEETLERKHYLKVGDLEIDRHRFEVRMAGRAVEVTPREFDLLAALAGSPGRVFGRDELLDLVWGRDGFVEPRTVDVHLARLRAKFMQAQVPSPAVETVRGIGYRFREPA